MHLANWKDLGQYLHDGIIYKLTDLAEFYSLIKVIDI